jgi:hypothetical protein
MRNIGKQGHLTEPLWGFGCEFMLDVFRGIVPRVPSISSMSPSRPPSPTVWIKLAETFG